MNTFKEWKPLAGLHLLVVEDNADEQRLISFYIEQSGGLVYTEGNGREAVNRVQVLVAESAPLHAVVMDLNMPVFDGIRATEAMRDDGFEGPIIATSAHADQADVASWITAGCDVYLDKPVTRHGLIGTIVRECCALMVRDAVC